MTKMLRLPESVHLLGASEPVTLILDNLGVAIHGQSFMSQAVYSDLSEKYPDGLPGLFNIGMLHTCANGRQGHDPYAPCTIQGLSIKGYDYWALGHIHKRETLSEDPLIIFPGNLQGRHIGETGPKGCMLVTVDEKGTSSPEFRPLDIVRWEQCEVDLSGTASESALFERVLDNLTRICSTTELPLIVRLRLGGECQAHEHISSDMEWITNEIRSESITLGGGRIWIEKIILETAPPANAHALAATGPVAELLDLIGGLTSDPEYLQRAGDSLRELWTKLPKEVKDSEEAVSPEDSNGLSKLIGEVPAMLLRRLKNLQ
jgi:DNA repair exonuclease SbcCD nuclease subunit